jgi:hypothetical protein
MKRSYMTRNMLKNNTAINVQVNKGTQNLACNKTTVNFEHGYTNSLTKTLKFLYSKSKNYNTVMQEIVLPEVYERPVTISQFNLEIIKRICNYLNIETNILDTSDAFANGLKAEDSLIDITKKLDGTTYINAPGGQTLYSKENFHKHDITLKFIKMGNLELENPYLSILHQLFTYPKQLLIEQISNYSLF